MVRHWLTLIARTRPNSERHRIRRALAINALGAATTALVLVIVLITKFLSGAWITLVAISTIYGVMVSIRRHYDRVAREIAANEDDLVLPSRVHAIVLVSKVHLPTMRALAYARATRPDILEAVTVNCDVISYAKGAPVLKQLVAGVGQQPVLAGLPSYFTAHQFANTELSDLLRELESASGRDLTGWTQEWLQTAGCNTLRASFETDGDGAFPAF